MNARTARRFGSAWWAAVASVLALGLMACTTAASPGLRAESNTEPAAAPTADDAVRLMVESDGATYAGDCAVTRSPEDLGKVCSKLVEERGGARAYLIGRTFSEFTTWVFVEQTAAGWRVNGTTALDFFAPSLEIPWPR